MPKDAAQRLQEDAAQRLQEKWQTIASTRAEYSRQLREMANESVGDHRLRYLSLSKWFKRNRSLDEALQSPDVLAVCLPQIVKDESIDVSCGARTGAGLMGLNLAFGAKFFYLAMYATVVLSGIAFLAWAFSNWLMPQFAELYDEFGIGLPVLTTLVLRVSQWLRKWGLVFVFLPLISFAVLSLLMIFNRTQPVKKITASWTGARNSIAAWAWHVSLLLEAGLTQESAMQIASENSQLYSLRNLISQTNSRVEELVPEGQQPDVRSFFGKEFSLLETALKLPESQGKPAAIRSVAAYYWEPGYQLNYWLVHWLITYFLWGAVALFVFAFACLFLPLMGILSGLTGF